MYHQLLQSKSYELAGPIGQEIVANYPNSSEAKDVKETLAELAIEHGGHVRVGLEDYAGPRQPRNEELVAEIVEMAGRRGRAVATSTQAAEILGLRRR